jgi:hypothetical protein
MIQGIKKTPRIVAAVATAAMYFSMQPSLYAVSYEIHGFLDRVGFRDRVGSNGLHGLEVFTNESSPFTMVVSGGQWQLKNNESGISYSEISCDGTNIFHFNHSEVISFHGKGALLPDSYQVVVEEGPIPSGGYTVQIPWLAFASSAVAESNWIDLPAPWLNARYSVRAHAYASKVEVLNNSPHLPGSISFTLAEDRANKAAASPWLVHEGPPASHPDYQKWKPYEPYGFTGATYQVLATTNIHGLCLPVSFELVTFDPPFDPSLTTQITEIYCGTNIVIREIASKKIEPRVSDKPIFVTDFRFYDRERHIDFIRYVARQWIISARSPDLEGLFDQKLKDPSMSPCSLLPPAERKQNSNWEVRTALFIVFISPLLLVTYRWIFKRAATNVP